MTKQIQSREYKVMLYPNQFIGKQTDLFEQAQQFWQTFKQTIKDLVFDTDGKLDKLKKKRLIRFYDTGDRSLRNADYVFRERVELNLQTEVTRAREVTLKFRHPDRYVSQKRDMSAANAENGKTKFEEDIKLPFISLYSFSTKQGISEDKSFQKLNDIGDLYPDFKQRVSSQDNLTISIVNNFTAKELVIEGADFQIRDDPKVEADCALVVWYEYGADESQPVVVEFSFKYKNDEGEYDGDDAQKAYDVFRKLVEDKSLGNWVNPEGKTKTAYVYLR